MYWQKKRFTKRKLRKGKNFETIDQRKSAKYRMQQAKTLSEKEETKNEYSDLNRQLKRSCRADKNEWLEKKGEEAEDAAGKSDAKNLCRIIKGLTGNKTSSNVPITDKNKKVLATAQKQEVQQVEHFKETPNQPDPEKCNFDNEIHLPKLNVNVDVITEEETASAISKMKNNKAAGLDEMTAELMKAGGQTIISTLTTLLKIDGQSRLFLMNWEKALQLNYQKRKSNRL